VIYHPRVRTCARIGCSTLAAATAVLHYGDRTVEVIDLVREPTPGLVDLCPAHVARLTPPMGWTIADRRVASAIPA